MKRLAIVVSAAVVTASLVAPPSMASTPSSAPGASSVGAETKAIYVPSRDLPKRMRDKMPYVSKNPYLVGNVLVFAVDISPMRIRAKAGALLDRVGGQVTISRAGVDLTRGSFASDPDGKVLLKKRVTPRLITRAGEQTFRIPLPSEVAADLRKIPLRKWFTRVGIAIYDDKDIDTGRQGYERRQWTSNLLPPALGAYLASRRSAVEPAGFGRTSVERATSPSEPRKDASSNTPGTIVVFNGSPYDLNVAANSVQCVVGWSFYNDAQQPGTLASNASFEFFNVSQIASDYWYEETQADVNARAANPWNVVGKQALSSLAAAGLVSHITESFARGMNAFFGTMAMGLILKGVIGAIVDGDKTQDACTDAGSAMTFAWTNASVGASQTEGNVSYWVPSFSRTSPMMGVAPTSIPATAPESPLTAYNATSANGLAVSPEVLQRELGMGGTVTLTTINTSQQNGSYEGFWCNFRDQQVGNPNSSTKTEQYGSTSLGGGTTADWGPCNATSVDTDADYNATNYFVSGPGSDLENEGFTLLIGYSTTAYNTAGPSPDLPPTTAETAGACVGTAAPCAYLAPAKDSTPASIGCTPGTWDMLTPWNESNPTMNLSAPPSAYSASSELTMQLAFTGVTADGAPVTYFAPEDLGGSVTSSFTPTAVNSWLLSPANLAAVQDVLGGPGGYVNEWMCVMTANTAIPSGIPASATAMNLGWYSVPVIVPVANPAGNVLSPPAS